MRSSRTSRDREVASCLEYRMSISWQTIKNRRCGQSQWLLINRGRILRLGRICGGCLHFCRFRLRYIELHLAVLAPGSRCQDLGPRHRSCLAQHRSDRNSIQLIVHARCRRGQSAACLRAPQLGLGIRLLCRMDYPPMG